MPEDKNSSHPNLQEVYKCFNKDISMTRPTEKFPISLTPGDLYLGITLFAPLQTLLKNCFLVVTPNVPCSRKPLNYFPR
jgi:hypothetical protein